MGITVFLFITAIGLLNTSVQLYIAWCCVKLFSIWHQWKTLNTYLLHFTDPVIHDKKEKQKTRLTCLHHGQESVQQINCQDEGLCAVTEETSQAPEVLHFGIAAFRWNSSSILGKENTFNILVSIDSCVEVLGGYSARLQITSCVDSIRARPASFGR